MKMGLQNSKSPKSHCPISPSIKENPRKKKGRSALWMEREGDKSAFFIFY